MALIPNFSQKFFSLTLLRINIFYSQFFSYHQFEHFLPVSYNIYHLRYILVHYIH